MNGWSAKVSKLTDRQLQAEIDKCSAKWMDYADPATDKFYWYRALLEEAKHCYIFKNNEPVYLTYHVARVLGLKMSDRHYGMTIGGCGMDMGFHIVYSLGRALFPKGFKVGPKGTRARNGDKSGWDNDGGYALQHRHL